MRRLISLLGSLKISVVLLVVLAVVLGWGTMIESTESREAAQRVYGALWFYVLQWFLAVNVLFSLIDRWPRNRYRIGFAVTHGAILVILVGSLVTVKTVVRGQLALWEGESSSMATRWEGETAHRFELPFTIRLESFEIDTYPGTGRPAMFRSRVVVEDAANGVTLPAVIEMNKELAYGGYKFFQSSYQRVQGREMSVLSVARDPGQPIVFVGYFLLVGGMILVLVTRIQQRREVAARSGAGARTAAALLLVGLAAAAAPGWAATVPPPDAVEALRRLPVQNDGRVMPFDTEARDAVWTVTGLAAWPGIDPVAMVAGWHLDPDGWIDEPIVKIGNRELQGRLELPAASGYASLRDLAGKPELTRLFQEYRTAQQADQKLSPVQKAAQELENRLVTLQQHLSRRGILARPGTDPQDRWRPVTLADAAAMKTIENEIRQSAPGFYPTDDAIERELRMNAFRWTRAAWIALALAALATLWGFRRPAVWLDWVGRAGVVVGFGIISWGIATRWQVAGRIPASNMYESMLFLSWGLALFAVLSPFFKNRLVLANTTLMATLAMFLVDIIPFDRFIHPIPPVLAGTPWLAIHVPIIMVGYAVLALATLVAHFEIGVEIFAGRRVELRANLQELLYFYIHIGSIFLVAGILTGSIWAASSWGRYWGWDPKEVWSLIAFLAYMAILHARFDKMLGPFGVAATSILAFQTILMTYLGVNYVLAAGLHSYGFGGSRVVGSMIAVALAELLFLVAGAWAHRRNTRAGIVAPTT